MRVRVKKWGNSLAVRIPKPFAEEVEVHEGSIVDLSVSEGSLVAAPARPRRLSLTRLLKKVTKANLHGEVDAGPAVGRESW